MYRRQTLPLFAATFALFAIPLASRADQPPPKKDEPAQKEEQKKSEVELLVEKLDSRSFSDREKAYARLLELGEKAVPELKQLVEKTRPESRQRLETIITVLQAGPKLAPLIRQLGDPRLKVREQAAKRLLQMGPAAVPALREAMRAPDPELRTRAQQLIQQIQKKK